MPIFYNDMPLNKAILLNQMSDPTVGNNTPQEPEPVPWSPTDHPVFMPQEDMYMLTGDYPNYDPNGTPLMKDGKDLFTSRNEQLVEKLQTMAKTNPKVQFEACKGRYDQKDERSVLLKGLPLNDVIKLAKEHGQASIVHLPPYPAANRMVYVNGPHANEHEHGIRENTKTFASPPSDAYSFIPSLGKYLRLDFNWGNYHPNESQDSCPEDTGGPQEPAMKSEKTVMDAAKAIAELLKKEIKQHEDFLVELRKSDKCGKCGKSPCACEGDKKCSKCGDIMKMDKCSKCDMSDVHKMDKADRDYSGWKKLAEEKSAHANREGSRSEDHLGASHAHYRAARAARQEKGKGSTEASHHDEMSATHKQKYMGKSESDIVEIAQFLAVADALVKAEGEKKGVKRLQDDPQSLTDGGEGPKKIPVSKTVPAPGSGDDAKTGKPEKAVMKSVQGIKSEESVSKSLDLMIDLVKAFDHKSPMAYGHAAPAAAAHIPPVHQPAAPLHAHAGPTIPKAVSHTHPMMGKLDALKHQAASMKKPKIPSVK